MYPPPPESVVQRLRDSVLEVLSFGKYVVHLVFEDRTRISISAPFRFSERERLVDSPVHELPLTETRLVRLLGENVVDASCDTDGTLEIQFSNGDVLVVYANDPAYEAYTLFIDGQEFIV